MDAKDDKTRANKRSQCKATLFLPLDEMVVPSSTADAMVLRRREMRGEEKRTSPLHLAVPNNSPCDGPGYALEKEDYKSSGPRK